MGFSTDRQTLDDLNIFGHQRKQSIYGLFNQTTTRGGGQLLEQMFKHPLSNAAEINRRVNIIQFFSLMPAFKFSSHQLDVVEKYLQNTDVRTKLGTDGISLIKKLSNIVAEDPTTRFVSEGVNGVISLMQCLLGFFESLNVPQANPYHEDRDTAITLLTNINKDGILREKQSKKLTPAQIAGYDVYFRFDNRDKLSKLLKYIYLADVYFTLSKVAKERKLSFPFALNKPGPEIIIEQVFHLQLSQPVPNNFRLSAGQNVMFLTGANMAGKSTFMKTVGVSLYLAHMGFPVPAKSLSFSVMDGIYTTINLPDNLGMGTSHFYAEVLRVKKIAKELAQSKKILVIIDELFRGTNVKDAFEATVAITGAFSCLSGSGFIISTHIIEAAETIGKNYANINFSYLPTRMKDNTPFYTYNIEQGITEDRHGMVIINNEGILDILQNGQKTK